MHSIKTILGALAVLPVLGALCACSEDEADYTAAQQLRTAGVYFAADAGTVISTPKDASEVTYDLQRQNVKGDLDVALHVECASSAFHFPATVHFADGENSAPIRITYDGAQLEYGDMADLAITLADSTYTTPYGLAAFHGTIGAPEPWAEPHPYNSAGTCSWEYTQFWSGTDEAAPFLVSENLVNPDLMQITVKNVFYGADAVMLYDKSTGHVSMQPTFTAYNHSTYGPVYVCDFNTYLTTVLGKAEGDFTPSYGTFDEEAGIITIPLIYYVDAGNFGASPYYEYIYLDGYVRKDYTVAATYVGHLTDAKGKSSAVVDIQLGADVESANVAVVPGELTQETLDAIISGEYAGLVSTEQSGELKFDASDYTDGDYTVVAVSFADGEAQSYDSSTFPWSTAGAESFKDIYVGTYTWNPDCFWSNEDGSAYTETLTLAQSTKDDTHYVIKNWAGVCDFSFHMAADGTVTVDEQDINCATSNGATFVCELNTYAGQDMGLASSYDAEKGIFHFAIAYYCEAGCFGYGEETFSITDDAVKARLARAVNNHGRKHVAKREAKPMPRLHRGAPAQPLRLK